jgi:hypothetical protein
MEGTNDAAATGGEVDLHTQIRQLIVGARRTIARGVDVVQVRTNFEIGRHILEREQQGEARASYGAALLQSVSKRLVNEFGNGFSKRNLELMRRFFVQYQVRYRIAQTVSAQLTWSHYTICLRIENQTKRLFYETEAIKNFWSVRQLERQINSQLYERLILSNDPETVLSIARSEKQPTDAREIIKDPMVLEFLGLKQEACYYEKDLESKIITHLQEFLLELGNGFAFMSRQKRIHLDGDDFFIDLVLYNRLLQCFVIIEIKTGKITHQDIGQLQMYVNYHDRFEKKDNENPTIGILLCADKNDAVVKITLPEKNQTIVASKYQLYLPSEEQLLKELKKFN